MKKTTVIGTTLLGILLGARLAGAATQTEWTLPFPSASPLQIAAGCTGVYYIDFDGPSVTNYLGRLRSSSNSDEASFEEMATPFANSTGDDLQTRPRDGAVFMTDLSKRALVLADLDRAQLTVWTIPPAADSGPRTLAFDSRGRVLFQASGANVDAVIGRLDPTTGLVETWTIPESIVTPSDLDFAWRIVRAADDTVFFNVTGFGHRALLVRLDLRMGVFTSWITPEQPVFGMAADGTGAVYFQEVPSLRVARFVPATSTLTEWTFMPAFEFDQNMVFDSGRLFFGTNGPHTIASLDPSSTGTDSTLSPVVSDPVTASSVVVKPVVTMHHPRRHAQATGTVMPSAPTTAGPFTVFPGGASSWVAGDRDGTIYSTDDVGTIARLAPEPGRFSPRPRRRSAERRDR